MPRWTFVTNHGAVLAIISHHGQVTAREIARDLGITERSVHRIISDLEEEGYIERQRQGRLNFYTVDHDMPLRRPESRDIMAGDLIRVLTQNRTLDPQSTGQDS
ncbi:MAG: MarR family transcriptional regulator [Chloroflexi bacterium]|nr:MarR family transcriptional regulator [Chloroflexota bacterium]MBI4198612.1 MarR family transcriptional regulator [Chloroflexota bacterium]